MKNKIKIILMIISYVSLLLLIMPATKVGIIATALFMIIGSVIIFIKNPKIDKNRNFLYLIPLTVFFVSFLGASFYNVWVHSSLVAFVSSFLHIPVRIFIGIVAAFLSVSACQMIFFAFQQITKKITLPSNVRSFATDLSCCLLASCVTIAFSQIMMDTGVFSMGIYNFFWGTLVVSVVTLFIYCLSGKMNVSVTVSTAMFMIISVVNVYVRKFRGRFFEPIDIFSASTAMNVAENYSIFPVPFKVVLCLLFWILTVTLVFCVCYKTKYKPSVRSRVVLFVSCVLGINALLLYIPSIKMNHWQQAEVYINGYVLDFVSKIEDIFASKPDGYSKENVDNIADQYAVDIDSDKKPHIIAIMNEAFSDLNAVGELSTNEEVMPFISSLKKNTVSGYALASVYGGNTSNSEFEFLTGNSMAYLSPNAVPYQQYIKSPSYSAVSYLKEKYGYKCIAMHPFLSSGWNRPDTYSNFGFDKCLFVDDFPQKDYVREYISDREMYEKIVSEYEENKQDPMFIFGVSMQNHGGYDYNGKNYEQTVSLEGMDGSYPDAEQYLSLIRETDKATEYLISYFSNVDDDVVIVFFGDHQPRLSDAFYSELGGEADTIDKQQNKYKVPFFVWANYDIEEEYVECTSLNYLSTYMYEAAKIPLPAYNQFLSELEDVIPSMNAHGYYSNKKGCYVSFDEATDDEKVWLDKYEQLQYNNLFDKKNRNSKLFPVLNKE